MRTFSPAEYIGALEASLRTPESAAPVLGAALVSSGSVSELGWTPRAVLVAPAVASAANTDYLSPIGWAAIPQVTSGAIGSALGYTPANDANVVKLTGSQTNIAGQKTFTDLLTATGVRVSGGRPVSIDGTNGVVTITGEAGGWANGLHFAGFSGAALGGFGAYGGGNALNYYYIGTFGSQVVTVIPGSGVDIAGAVTASKLISSANPVFYVEPQAATSMVLGGIIRAGQVATIPTYTWDGDPDTGLYNPSPDVLGIKTGGVERVRVGSDGAVGIGVTPTYQLDVYGSSPYIRAQASGGNAAGILVQNSNSSLWALQANTSGNLEVFDFTNNASRLVIDKTSGAITASGNIQQGYASITPSYRSVMTAIGARNSEVGDGAGVWQTGYREEYSAGGLRSALFGKAPVAQFEAPAVATDLASAITSVNTHTVSLTSFGLYA